MQVGDDEVKLSKHSPSSSISDDQPSSSCSFGEDSSSLIQTKNSSSDAVEQFPRRWMKFVEKIGDGLFGEVDDKQRIM